MSSYQTTTYDALRANRWRTAWLFLLFPLMLATITYLAIVIVVSLEWGTANAEMLWRTVDLFLTVMPVMTVVALVWIAIALLGGRRMVLAFGGAKPIGKRDHPLLVRAVENIGIQVGIPTPAIYIIDDESLNAFATGYSPDRAAVAITEGMLTKLSKPELEAVIAHEMGHILHRDTRVMLVALTMVGIIQIVSELLLRIMFRLLRFRSTGRSKKSGGAVVLVVLAAAIVIWFIGFLGALFMQLGISRRREFMADAESAHITRHPESLIDALQKITRDARVEVLDGKRTIAAMCIADPLEQKRNPFEQLQGLLSTHPPIRERIRALEALSH